jgi:hypothetical protein
MNYLAYTLVAALLLAGCSHGVNSGGLHEARQLPTEFVSTTPTTATPTGPTHANDGQAALVDIQLAPELKAVLNGGPDVSVDLIELAQLQAWQAQAEVRLRLEIERGKSEYLNELLRLAGQSEEEFLQRFDVRSVVAGDRTGYQLRMFRMIRSRIDTELKDTKASIVQLEALLVQVAAPTTS